MSLPLRLALLLPLLAIVFSVGGSFVFAATPSEGGTNGTPFSGGSGGTPAEGGVTSSNGTLQNPLQNIDSLPELIDAILHAVVQIGAILLTVMLVWVGFLFVVAQGNPEKLSTARSALIWTVIGGLILLGAEAISQVIQATVKGL